ncbi:nuclear transport factor 2 family protein [Loigolactobacillus iwatensis]|uniref:nuclear transport factor 2 family protein n=1 Tax=Loigolactobacillus iwatensis TaxID=1267156 RepID=UPI0013DD97C7|nr:nuclear transport factor 2 family protein [Loigolactobacillus iwatensis]
MTTKNFYDAPLNQLDKAAFQDRAEIRELLEYERYCRDNGLYPQEAACYSDDARIHVSWYDGPAKGYFEKVSAANGGGAKHKINSTSVWVNGNKAIGEMTVMMLSPRTKLDGQEVDLHSYARIFSRLKKVNGVWKLTDGDCIYERDELIPAVPGQAIAIDTKELATYRSSYQGLCYILARTGLQSSQDLPGEDKPETVAKLYNEASAWFFA